MKDNQSDISPWYWESWFNTQDIFGLLAVDTRMNIFGWNKWFEKHLHIKASEVLSKNLFKVLPELNEQNRKKYFEDALQGIPKVLSSAFHTYLIPVKSDQNDLAYMPQFARISPIFKNNKVSGVLCYIEDVTERYLYEKKLKEHFEKIEKTKLELGTSEKMHRTIISSLSEGLVLINNKGEVELFNNSALKYLGMSKVELAGSNVFLWDMDLINESGKKIDYSVFGKKIFSKKEVSVYEYIIGIKDTSGKISWFSVSTEPVYLTGDKSPDYHIISFRDVSEIKKSKDKIKAANRELEAANAAKDQLFSLLGHDLRSPFNPLLGLSEILFNNLDELSEDEIREISGQINRNATQIYYLLDNLLNWSRLQMQKISFEPEKFSLPALFDEIYDTYEIFFNEKKIELKIINKLEQDEIFADRFLIRSVMLNLLNNALKFSYTGSVITIATSNNNNNIKISVIDEGAGMDKQTIDRILNSGKMPSVPGTSGEPGTGVGMLLVKEFVAMHNGQLEIESSPGKGSLFNVIIPLKILSK